MVGPALHDEQMIVENVTTSFDGRGTVVECDLVSLDGKRRYTRVTMPNTRMLKPGDHVLVRSLDNNQAYPTIGHPTANSFYPAPRPTQWQRLVAHMRGRWWRLGAAAAAGAMAAPEAALHPGATLLLALTLFCLGLAPTAGKRDEEDKP